MGIIEYNRKLVKLLLEQKQFLDLMEEYELLDELPTAVEVLEDRVKHHVLFNEMNAGDPTLTPEQIHQILQHTCIWTHILVMKREGLVDITLNEDGEEVAYPTPKGLRKFGKKFKK